MKTPERWRALPRCALLVSIFDDTPWRYAMYAVALHGIKCHDKMYLHNLQRSYHQKVRKSRFSTWRPWPLTYDLDLWTHLRYCQGQSLHQISGPYIERFSRENANRRTDGQTDRRDRFYTLDRLRGREKYVMSKKLSYGKITMIKYEFSVICKY